MEDCCGQAAMVHADHVNSWWGVELRIPLLKHTKYYYFLCKVHESTDANTGEVSSLWNIIQDSEETSSIFQTHRARAFMIEGAALFGNDGVAKTLYLA